MSLLGCRCAPQSVHGDEAGQHVITRLKGVPNKVFPSYSSSRTCFLAIFCSHVSNLISDLAMRAFLSVTCSNCATYSCLAPFQLKLAQTSFVAIQS